MEFANQTASWLQEMLKRLCCLIFFLSLTYCHGYFSSLNRIDIRHSNLLQNKYIRSTSQDKKRLNGLRLFNTQIIHDFEIAIATSGAAYLWIQLWINLKSLNIVSSVLSRKIIHCTSAPIFICTWPLYASADGTSRLIASIVPLLQVIR